MTAALLLAGIVAALIFQLAVGIAVALRGHHRGSAPLDIANAASSPGSSDTWTGWREFRVARRAFEDSGHTQCSFYLEPVDGRPLPPFKAGQFLTFALQIARAGGGANASAATITRCYSLSDRPDPVRYRITVKRITAPDTRPELPAGVCSSHFHDSIKPGDVLKARAPAGRFFIDPDANVPAVFIAGGIGITPMMSMLRWCLAEQPERTIHLFYGLRHGAVHAFKQQLEQLAASNPRFHLNVTYSAPATDDLLGRDFHRVGHVDIDLLRSALPAGRHQFYVCGPPPMMASLVPALAAWGVPQQDIHFEAFGPASASLAEPVPKPLQPRLGAPLEVQFRRTGRTLLWDAHDTSLLDFAERQGVSLASGCRIGICGTCETALVSGTVRYAKRPDYEVAAGRCLLCVATPASALVLDA